MQQKVEIIVIFAQPTPSSINITKMRMLIHRIEPHFRERFGMSMAYILNSNSDKREVSTPLPDMVC